MLMRSGQSGCYGKIPQRGDFITRALDGHLVGLWDDWLQQGLSQCRERHGERWIDHYMISPVWRFVAGPGSLDQASWAGVMIPSVDRVGRYFPFTVMTNCGLSAPLVVMNAWSAWFDAAEALALESLADEFNPTSLDQCLADLPSPMSEATASDPLPPLPPLSEHSRQYQLGPAVSPLDQLAAVANDALRELCPAHVLWWSQGSAHVASSMLVTCGLPSSEEFVAMLDGDFAQSGWSDGGLLGKCGHRSGSGQREE